MIRNVVFDMGRVLICFDPDRFMDIACITDEADRTLIRKELFSSVEWAQMDLGFLTEETAEPLILSRFPERLKTDVSRLLFHWADARETIPGMEGLLKKLKGSGYRLYLLSNASVMHHRYWPAFAFSRLLDGKLISCDVGVVKPNPRIYQLFTEQFSLLPEETFFIDDMPANVAAAIGCGWSGCVFYGDALELEEKLIHAGIKIDR